MSKRKRAIQKQKQGNSPEKKAKLAKKQYYASPQAREDWEKKKKRRKQSNLSKRLSRGIPADCPLEPWENPSEENCFECDLKCSYRKV